MPISADAYLRLARTALDLVRTPAVADAWDRPSALPGMSVSGLSAHLCLQIINVPGVLLGESPPASVEVLTVDGHYSRSLWAQEPVDGENNRRILATAERTAAPGHDAVVDEAAGLLARLELILPGEDLGRPVLLPWAGWALSVGDFLHTRALELLIHTDDLATSVGGPTPEASPDDARIVIDTLVSLALRKHGVTSVLRALSRQERAPATIAAL